MIKMLLMVLVLLLPSAYAQDLCQTTLPQNVAPLETVGFSSRAELVSLQLQKNNQWLVLPIFEAGAGRFEFTTPLADVERSGSVTLRLQVGKSTDPELQTCPSQTMQVRPLPPATSRRPLLELNTALRQSLSSLKSALGQFGNFELPEQISAAEMAQLPDAVQAVALLELTLRSQNNLAALSDGTAPALAGATAEQKALLQRVLSNMQIPNPAPLRLSPPRPVIALPNLKTAPNLESVLFKNQNLTSLFFCTQPEMVASQLRDCFRWQDEMAAWNDKQGVYKKHSYKVLGAMSTVGIFVPPVEFAATAAGLAVFLHQTAIEALDGILPSSLAPLSVTVRRPPFFEDLRNAPPGILPLRWLEDIEVSASSKGYKLNPLALGDALLNVIGMTKVIGKLKIKSSISDPDLANEIVGRAEAVVFGRSVGKTDAAQTLGDVVAEGMKAILAEAGLDNDLENALPALAEAPAKTVKAVLLRPESLEVTVQPANGTFRVNPSQPEVDFLGLKDKDLRNFVLTFESEAGNDYFPNNRIAKTKFDLSVPELSLRAVAPTRVKPGQTVQIQVVIENAYLKRAIADEPRVGKMSVGKESASPGVMLFSYTAPSEGKFPMDVPLVFRHSTQRTAETKTLIRIDAESRIALSGGGGCVASLGKKQLSARVFDLENPRLTWRVVSGSGSITQMGLYTAIKNPPIQTVTIEATATGTFGGQAKTVKQTVSFTVGKCTCFAEFSTPDGQFTGRTMYFDRSGSTLRVAGPIVMLTPQTVVNQSITSAVQQSIIFGATLQGGRVSSESIVVFNNLKYTWNGTLGGQFLRSMVADPREGADVRYTITKETPERLEGSISGNWVSKDFDRVEKWRENRVGGTVEVWGKVFARLDFIAVRGEIIAGLTVGAKDVGKCLR